MNATVSVVIAGISVFLLSSVDYAALPPVEARAPGPSGPDRGTRPSPAKAVLEIADSEPATALLHAGDWLLKLPAISAIVGVWV